MTLFFYIFFMFYLSHAPIGWGSLKNLPFLSIIPLCWVFYTRLSALFWWNLWVGCGDHKFTKGSPSWVLQSPKCRRINKIFVIFWSKFFKILIVGVGFSTNNLKNQLGFCLLQCKPHFGEPTHIASLCDILHSFCTWSLSQNKAWHPGPQ